MCRPLLFQRVIGPLYHRTIPDNGVMHGRVQDGRGGGLLQPEAGGDDQGGEEVRERHSVCMRLRIFAQLFAVYCVEKVDQKLYHRYCGLSQTICVQ